MAKKFESDKELLKKIADLHLFHLPEHYKVTVSSEDSMDNDNTGSLPWSVPTRETRDMILAEEILRFASITDTPVTSRSAEERKISPDSSSETKFPVTNAAQKTTHIASAAGTSGSAPTQSAAGHNVQPSTSKSQEACIPVEAAVMTRQDRQPSNPPVFRPNIIPVTNRILAAIAQSKLDGSASNCHGPIILEPIPDDMEQYWPQSNEQLLGFFVENLKRMQGSDASNSSSPDSQAAARSSQSTSTRPVADKLTKLNQEIQQTDQLEDIVTKTMQKEQNETGEVDEEDREGGSSQQGNCQDKPKGDNDNDTYEEDDDQQPGSQPWPNDDDYATDTTPEGSQDQGEIEENSEENDDQQADYNNPNDSSAEGSQGEGVDDEPEMSEFPELDDDSLQLEWSRPEKRRLTTVIRDFSREMKRKELNYKKARLIKKGRIIAQAIESKICSINQEIIAVNKKSLRNLVLPLDQTQEYDWERVAYVLNAKRTPQECRIYWMLFLHPSVNSSDWIPIEVKAMEIIAQRHHFRNWDAIAQELNTGRTGHQCYLFYRQNLCPHTELRRNRNAQ